MFRGSRRNSYDNEKVLVLLRSSNVCISFEENRLAISQETTLVELEAYLNTLENYNCTIKVNSEC